MRCLHRVEAAFLLTLGLVGCQGVLERDDGLSDAPSGCVQILTAHRCKVVPPEAQREVLTEQLSGPLRLR